MDMLRRFSLTVCLALLLPIGGTALADRLLIEKVERDRDVSVPRHGLTMNQVEQRFGPPEGKVAAVGDPPIARWVYPEFTVYFEHQYVINSVVHAESGTSDA